MTSEFTKKLQKKNHRKRYKNLHNARRARNCDKQRVRALKAYSGGNPRCMCECGCTEVKSVYLDLDHVNSDGAAHRKALGVGRHGGHTMYSELEKRGWPNDPPLRVLCVKCNVGRHRNGGQCPELGLLTAKEKRIRKKASEVKVVDNLPSLFDGLE